MTALGALLVLVGLLEFLVGVVWLVVAAIRKGAMKPPTIVTGGGIAAFVIGVIVIGVSNTTSVEDQEVSDPLGPGVAAADVPGLLLVPTPEVLPSGATSLSGAAFAAMTAEEFESYLRQLDLSDEVVAEELANFPQAQATAIAWQSRFATPVPREWTVEELASCDLEDRKFPDLMSDCEVALHLAVIDGVTLYDANSEFRQYADRLSSIDSTIDGLMEDNALTSDEMAYLCEVSWQWEKGINEATGFIEQLGSDETVGVEVEIFRIRRFLEGVEQSCGSAKQEVQQEASAESDVPEGVLSGEVAETRWYGAADNCDAGSLNSWSLEKWEELALVYVGAAIVIGRANTEWSVSPAELRDFRDFLNGGGPFSSGDWERLNIAEQQVYSTVATATRVKSSGAILLDESLNPSFPHGWLGRYRELIPQLQDKLGDDGILYGSLAVPQGEQAKGVRELLGAQNRVFSCRTAEMQGQ